jgi:predicted outer membrane repeat protein
MLPMQLLAVFSCIALAVSIDVYVDSINGSTSSDICWTGGSAKPCATLDVALEALTKDRYRNNVTFYIRAGRYNLSLNYDTNYISAIHNVHFIGNQTTVTCETGAGLRFLKSSNISFHQVTFLQCGLLLQDDDYNHTSNSYDMDHGSCSDDSRWFRAAISFYNCWDIFLNNVTVSLSNGLGVDIKNSNGTVLIENSIFSYNRVNETELHILEGGGGMSILMFNDYNISNSNYTIRGCSFMFNNATYGCNMYQNLIYNNDNIYDSHANGGGLGIQLHDYTQDNSFLVDSCTFEGNGAAFGAGMIIQFADNTHNNTVNVQSCVFTENQCYGDDNSPPVSKGGGARVDFVKNTTDVTVTNLNNATFQNCQFIGNYASTGGAMSVIFSEIDEFTAKKLLSIIDCTFKRNIARNSGSALYISSWSDSTDGYLPTVLIQNSDFFFNYLMLISNSTTGMGCIYSDRVPLLFKESVIFSFNNGSALVVSGTELTVSSGGRLDFYENSGHCGAGISLINNAWITLNERCLLVFDKNKAHLHGGAIYAVHDGYQQKQYSESCFIRYKDKFTPPSKWNVKVTFCNNTASGIRNSIYIPSLLSCVWPASAKSNLQSDISNTLCWDGWTYNSSSCNSQEIKTSESYYKFKPNQSSEFNMVVYPGKEVPIPINFYDDKNNDVTNNSVFNTQIDGENTFVHKYMSNGVITLYGPPNTTALLTLSTLNPRVIKTVFDVTFLPCPPGFNTVKVKGKHLCHCSGDYSSSVKCDADNFKSYLLWGRIMSLNDKMETVVGHIEFKILYNYTTGYIEMPQNLSTVNDFFCSKLGRSGFLCSDCLPGKSAPMYGYAFECVDCGKEEYVINWLYFILLSFFPITVFFIIVVIFDINITSGPLNAFIFFAQVVSNPITVTRMNNQLFMAFDENLVLMKLALGIIVVPYGIWNLDFFQSVIPPFCIIPGLKSMHVYALNYIIAFYPLFLIAVCYVLVELHARSNFLVVCLWKVFSCCVRLLRRNWNFRASVIDAFATFLLLSYSKFCLITFYLLVPMYPVNASGIQAGDSRLFFDPSVVYLSEEHLPFFILAIIILIFVIIVPPVFLFVCATRQFQQCINHLNIRATKLRMFLEPFHGCYIDGVSCGETDRRYFSSFYFIFRIIAFGCVTLSYDIYTQRLIQIILITIMLLLIVILRPYKEDFYNKLDPAIFAALVIVLAIATYNITPNPSLIVNTLLIVAMLSPQVYMCCYLIKNFIQWIKLCRSREPVDYIPRLSLSFGHGQSQREVDLIDSTSSLPDRLINPKAYEALTKSIVGIDDYGSTDNH